MLTGLLIVIFQGTEYSDVLRMNVDQTLNRNFIYVSKYTLVRCSVRTDRFQQGDRFFQILQAKHITGN